MLTHRVLPSVKYRMWLVKYDRAPDPYPKAIFDPHSSFIQERSLPLHCSG